MTMNFRVKLFLLSFFVSNKVNLERGLDFLIISISAPLVSLDNLRSIVSPPIFTFVISNFRDFYSPTFLLIQSFPF
jgi:hypothetical protein